MAVQSRRVKLIADCLLGVAERFYRRISICGATLRYWRKRVRVERTIDAARRQSPVLKTGRVTGPPSLPHRTGLLTAPAHEAVHTQTRRFAPADEAASPSTGASRSFPDRPFAATRVSASVWIADAITVSNNNTGGKIFSAPPPRSASWYICDGAFRCPSVHFGLSSLMCLPAARSRAINSRSSAMLVA